MRRLLTPRWLGLHLFVVAVTVLCCFLGLWQYHRSESPTGGLQNLIYAIQWPSFAVFGLYLWIKTMREVLHPRAPAPPPAPVTMPAAAAAGAAPAAPVLAEDGDDELAAYNRYLAWLNRRDLQEQPP